MKLGGGWQMVLSNVPTQLGSVSKMDVEHWLFVHVSLAKRHNHGMLIFLIM